MVVIELAVVLGIAKVVAGVGGAVGGLWGAHKIRRATRRVIHIGTEHAGTAIVAAADQMLQDEFDGDELDGRGDEGEVDGRWLDTISRLTDVPNVPTSNPESLDALRDLPSVPKSPPGDPTTPPRGTTPRVQKRRTSATGDAEQVADIEPATIGEMVATVEVETTPTAPANGGGEGPSVELPAGHQASELFMLAKRGPKEEMGRYTRRVASEGRAKFGPLRYTEANRMMMRKYLYDIMRDGGARTSDVLRVVDKAVYLAMMPNVDDVMLRKMDGTSAVRERRSAAVDPWASWYNYVPFIGNGARRVDMVDQ